MAPPCISLAWPRPWSAASFCGIRFDRRSSTWDSSCSPHRPYPPSANIISSSSADGRTDLCFAESKCLSLSQIFSSARPSAHPLALVLCSPDRPRPVAVVRPLPLLSISLSVATKPQMDGRTDGRLLLRRAATPPARCPITRRDSM